MKLNCILLFLFFSVSQYSYAQVDTVKHAIRNYSDKIDSKVDQYGWQITDKTKKVDSTSQVVKNVASKYLNAANEKIDKYDKELNKTAEDLTDIPDKYIKKIDSKIEKYSSRITSKTEKTLTKLSRWEEKIHKLLQKVNPEAANRLFNNTQMTFATLLQKMKQGEAFTTQYKAQYNQYRDKLSTNLKYLDNQKDKLKTTLAKPVEEANEKMDLLTKEVDQTEATQAFIKERKKQLLDESIKYIGNSKYIKKINKEAYYYVETLKNYKQLFSDPEKTEKLASNLLSKVPGFQNFQQQNSQFASLFGTASSDGKAQNIAALPTRASMQNMLQEKMAAGGPNAQQIMSQNLQQATKDLRSLKDKIAKAGGNSSDMNMPDFKPNTQKSKMFLQRIEYGTDIQFAKTSNFIPATADIALNVGYKLNDKSLIGIAASYKMGIGSIQRIQITHQGLGLRSFLDWKLKKQFFISGGFEMNYNAQFKNLATLQNTDVWQQAGLIGLSKKLNIKTKFFKTSKFQILYDVLHKQHFPVTQPVLFRTGYNF